MSTKHPLFQEAIQIANGQMARATALEAKLRQITEHKADVEVQLRAANLAAERLQTFQLRQNGDLQCPICWIPNEVASALKPIPSSNSDDYFRCSTCGYELVIPSGGSLQ